MGRAGTVAGTCSGGGWWGAAASDDFLSTYLISRNISLLHL